MAEPQKKIYPYSRLFVYLSIGITLGWIIISVAGSVGYSIFWEAGRRNIIPQQEYEHVNDSAEALICLEGIRHFNRELRFNVDRLLKRYRQDPKVSMEMWGRWMKDWRKDFRTYKAHYKFLSQTATQNKYERELITAYSQLDALSKNYISLFSNLKNLDQNTDEELNRYLKSLQSAYIQ